MRTRGAWSGTVVGAMMVIGAWNAAGAQQTEAAQDSGARTLILPALGLRGGTPQKVSVALGIVAGTEWRADGRLHTRDIALFAEPGLAASRASLAVMGARNFGSGFGIAATALRTHDDSWTFSQNAWFAGGELFVWPVFLVGPRIGVFRGVSANAKNGWFWSADFGFGM